MKSYTERYDRLHLCCLDADSRGAGRPYWYIVTNGTTAHTAFRTREALLLWLGQRGLSLSTPLPPDRTFGGGDIIGEYTRALVMCDAPDWLCVSGEEYPEMDNGEYTLAKWDAEAKTLSVVNCNCRWRTVLPHRETELALDRGVSMPRSIDWLNYAYTGRIAQL